MEKVGALVILGEQHAQAVFELEFLENDIVRLCRL